MSLPINSARDRDPRSAFSLVELLVVLTVVALLAGLLLPTLARGKGKAQSAACANNLRQLGLAFMLYLPDHDDTFRTRGGESYLVLTKGSAAFLKNLLPSQKNS